MKKLNKCSSSKVMKVMMAMVCAMLFFMGQKTVSLADETGKAITSAKVRQAPDVNSEMVGGLAQGTAVTIVNEVNDASGTLWYEISAGNTNGYVRSDLIEKGAAAPASQTGSTAAGAETGPETPLDAQYAKVTATAAKIRSSASTSAGSVDSLPQGTSLIVNGQTTGSDGRIWYYALFKGTNGEEKSGYVREDIIELGEMVPTEEPEQPEEPDQPEEPVEEPVVSLDYQAVYEDPDEDGIYEWYLHDNTGAQATRQKIEDLVKAAHAQSVNAKIDAATISKQRIAIVILVALVIILSVVLTFMFFKLRDSFYEEDDDDSDAWKAERDRSRSNKSSAVKQEEPVRRKSAAREEQQPPVRKKSVDHEKKAPAKEVAYEDDGAPRTKPAPKKKAKNFLADDDDFEFEFLNNVKDKDKGGE